MAQTSGRISETDRERVRDANRIDVVVGDYVALKRAGPGNVKGLCPFHDEKTPSFTVSVDRGFFHCFGCGEGGDVFDFLMKIDQLSYVEAVQVLAERAGITLSYTSGPATSSPDRGSRSRLIAVTAATAAYYAERLADGGPEPAAARQYLTDRGFDAAAAQHFGCGFAPGGWDTLIKHLAQQRFSIEEMIAAGVAKRGQKGPIDAFHRRLVWSIRDARGDVVGFGARRLFDDDRMEAKYVNTSGDGRLYRKSQVLFGLDLARRDIVRQRQVVVVEGYTDVMAMHLAGVTTAVATCGTAFGEDHIDVLRRYLMDDELVRGEVVYVFDGDAAGQKAALKAFDSDQRFAANTFVAVAPGGMDPCELRQDRGDAALRDLVRARVPLFRFAITHALDQFDLETVEGRTGAVSAAAPMVARIKEDAAREGYVRELADRIGVDSRSVAERVSAERRRAIQRPRRRDGAPDAPSPAAVEHSVIRRPDPADPRTTVERETLKLVLQFPALVASGYGQIGRDVFTEPAYAAVHDAVLAAGGPSVKSGAAWVDAVAASVTAGPLRSLVSELAVESLQHRSAEPDPRYAGAILARMAERVAAAQERELVSALRRAEAAGDRDRAHRLTADLGRVAAYRRALADRARGVDST